MQVIISGCDRVEFCKVQKKKDFDRRFFLTRGQLYFVPTDALVRTRVYEYGKERESQATIAYEENMIVPYEIGNRDWSMNSLLAAIDRYKMMTDYGWLRPKDKPWFQNIVPTIWSKLTAPTGLIIVVVLYLLVTGGIQF